MDVGGKCTFFVAGHPRPKGNHKVVPRGGAGVPLKRGGKVTMHYAFADLFIVEDEGKLLKEWVRAIQVSALDDKPRTPMDGPFGLDVTFYLHRPEKPKDDMPTTRPDYDKLVRAIGDALQSIYWKDDSQIVDCTIRKRYSKKMGAQITISHHGSQLHLL